MQQDRSMARAKPEELWDGPTEFEKKIAIYGGGYTRRLIWDHPLVDDDCEIWSGNHVWNEVGWGADIPRLDRCFDVHLTDTLGAYDDELSREHFEWLQREHPFPIYMQDPDERFPSAQRYPYEEIVEEFFGRQYRGKEIKAAFGSMVDFITAMAVYEGADWIGYFGVEMGSSTEHRYQIPYGHVWLGICAGRGVTTWVPDDPRCQLLRQQVYAYEGFQMVDVQRLTELHEDYDDQFSHWKHISNEAQEEYAKANDAIKAGKRWREAREATAMAKGATEAIDHLIETIDERGFISRQSLEHLYEGYERQRRNWMTAAHTWIGGYRALAGMLHEARQNGGAPDGLAENVNVVGEKVRRARTLAAGASGMMLAIKHVIKICDLIEPDTTIRAGLFEDLKMEDVKPC